MNAVSSTGTDDATVGAGGGGAGRARRGSVVVLFKNSSSIARLSRFTTTVRGARATSSDVATRAGRLVIVTARHGAVEESIDRRLQYCFGYRGSCVLRLHPLTWTRHRSTTCSADDVTVIAELTAVDSCENCAQHQSRCHRQAVMMTTQGVAQPHLYA
jgi:hypothetical protein